MRKNALLVVLSLLMLSLWCFRGCEDSQVKDYGEKVVFVELCDTSAVWRVKLHPLGSYYQENSGIIVIALEDGKQFTIKYDASSDATKDWMLINEGDTVVYKQDKIISIIWKSQ